MSTFTLTVPENYDRFLTPAFFKGFAESLADRVVKSNPAEVLELACGTGVVSQMLASRVARLVATDFSEAMLEFAKGHITGPEWQIVDGCALPFETAAFDAVVCQFGVMFFPDKPLAMSEALRVLRPGGHLLFNTWGAISANQVFQIVEETLAALFPEEETPFMPTPFTMADANGLSDLVRAAGFEQVEVVKERQTVAPCPPASLASGFTYGTPLGLYLRDQGYELDEVHAALTAAFKAELGAPVESELNALVCTARKA